MSAQFLLPCHCGEKVLVDVRQAGEVVVCSCGNSLEVPAMRQLRTLETVLSEEERAIPQWGPAQAVTLLGLIVAVAAGAVGTTLWLNQPAAPQLDTQRALNALDTYFDRLTPMESWRVWTNGIRDAGLVEYENPLEADYQRRRNANRRWMGISWAASGVGLLLVLAGSLWKRAAGPATT